MESNRASYLIGILSLILIINGLVSIYTAQVIRFSSKALIYPPVEVIYTEFDGSTTNFSAFDEDGLKIITNLTLEVNQYGKVIFDGTTDLDADKDMYNKIDLDADAEFSSNMIEIDTDSLQSLKKSASVFIYNVTMEDPRILVDGFVCPPTICTIIDYSNSTLVFRVNQFSYSYSAEETPEEVVIQPAPSGGAATPAKSLVPGYGVDKEFIKATLKQGETLLDYVEIENTGETPLTFRANVEGLEDNVVVSEDSFVLNPGEKKTLTVAFSVIEDAPADVYTGKLVLQAGGITKTVLLVMEVREKSPLFDIYVDLEGLPLEAHPGDEVTSEILLQNFGDIVPVDVKLYYSLRDFEGNEILYKYDTIAVEELKQVTRKVRLPQNLAPGFYVFYSRVEYGNQTASSSGLIKVVGTEPVPEIPLFVIIGAAVAALVIILSIILYKKSGLLDGIRYRIRFGRRYMSEIESRAEEEVKRDVEREMMLLEKEEKRKASEDSS